MRSRSHLKDRYFCDVAECSSLPSWLYYMRAAVWHACDAEMHVLRVGAESFDCDACNLCSGISRMSGWAVLGFERVGLYEVG